MTGVQTCALPISSNWLRGSSNAGKPHSYSASLSGLGLWVPVRLDTSIGKNTKALDSTSATPRNSSIGRYSDRSTKETLACLTRSEEHTSELQSLMRISYAVFCLKKKKTQKIS